MILEKQFHINQLMLEITQEAVVLRICQIRLLLNNLRIDQFLTKSICIFVINKLKPFKAKIIEKKDSEQPKIESIRKEPQQ